MSMPETTPRIKTKKKKIEKRAKAPPRSAEREFRWMSYPRAASFIPAAAGCRPPVSAVARSARGFMGQYRLAGSVRAMRDRPVAGYKNQTWGQRRRNFIKRHLAQYRRPGGRTYRRWLALVMWAYNPGPVPDRSQCE